MTTIIITTIEQQKHNRQQQWQQQKQHRRLRILITKIIADFNSDNNNKDAVNDNNDNIKTSINDNHKYCTDYTISSPFDNKWPLVAITVDNQWQIESPLNFLITTDQDSIVVIKFDNKR